MLTSFYDNKIVIQAALMTAIMVSALTTYAFTTKTDFTLHGGALMMCLFGLVGVSLLNMFLGSKLLDSILCWFGAFLMGLYLIFDTQAILGRGSLSLSIDDYIFAAMNLYIDIIQIFIYILRIIGDKKD